jgi:acyl-CoA synthetase (AMP-forming)/AMP-acid ligase II
VVVFGVPDDDLGEIVVASVVVRTGASVTAEALRSFVAARLARFEVPERWSVSGEPLPVNASGKIDKVTVRREWLARAAT